MDNQKKGQTKLTIEDFEEKIRKSFILIKKDIKEISVESESLRDKNKEIDSTFQNRLNQLNLILSSIQNLKEKFSVEVRRYKEETRLFRITTKNLEKRIRDLEISKELQDSEDKLWNSWINS